MDTARIAEPMNGDKLSIVENVKQEIDKYFDPSEPLRKWISKSFTQSSFASTGNSAVTTEYSILMNWVSNHGQYNQKAIAEFARGADGWIMAYAKINGETVFSMEISAPNSKNHAKMPDICSAHSIDHINTFDFLRRVGAQFNSK